MLIPVVNASAQSVSDDIAMVYARSAVEHYRVGELTAAAEEASRALSFASTNDDARYVETMTDESKGIRARRDTLAEILRSSRFSAISRGEVAEVAAGLLDRLHDYPAVIDLFSGLSAENLAPHDAVLLSRAYMAVGATDSALRTLREALAVNATQADIALQLVRYDPSYRDTELPATLERQPILTGALLKPASEALLLTTDDTMAETLYHLLVKTVEAIPLEATVGALGRGVDPSVSTVRTLVDNGLLGNRRLALSALARLRGGSARSYLLRTLVSYTGTSSYDADADGYDEEVTTYADGAVQQYRFDGDQDGVPDLDIRYAQGSVSSITRAEPTRRIVAEYDSYPMLTSLRVEDADGTVAEWTLGSDRLPFPLVDSAAIPVVDVPQIRSSSSANLVQLLSASTRLSYVGNDGSFTADRNSDVGESWQVTVPAEEDGFSLDLLINRGIIERLTIDLDGDGNPEVEQHYSATGSVLTRWIGSKNATVRDDFVAASRTWQLRGGDVVERLREGAYELPGWLRSALEECALL